MDYMSSEQYNYYSVGANPSECKVVEGAWEDEEAEDEG